MSSKKTKIIEFDEGTIALVNKYGEAKGINTFSGAIREMVANELGKYGMNEIREENKGRSRLTLGATSGATGGFGGRMDIVSQLSNDEAEVFQEVKDIIRMNNEVEIEFTKLFDDINKKKEKGDEYFESKTVFEKLISHPIKPYDEYIEHIYTIVRGLFKVRNSNVVRVDEILKMIQREKRDIRLDDIDIYNLESVEKADIYNVRGLIGLYRGKRRKKNDDYNELTEKYYEYKEGNVSKYSMIRALSEYVYEPNRENEHTEQSEDIYKVRRANLWGVIIDKE